MNYIEMMEYLVEVMGQAAAQATVTLPHFCLKGILGALRADCQESALILENLPEDKLRELILDNDERNKVLTPFFTMVFFVRTLMDLKLVKDDGMTWFAKIVFQIQPLLVMATQMMAEGILTEPLWEYQTKEFEA